MTFATLAIDLDCPTCGAVAGVYCRDAPPKTSAALIVDNRRVCQARVTAAHKKTRAENREARKART